MNSKWNDVPGTVVVEVCFEGGEYLDSSTLKTIPAELHAAIVSRFPLRFTDELNWWEVDIEFNSSGYHQDERKGTPDDCCPAEHLDERVMTGVRISPSGGFGYNEGQSVRLPADEASVIFELYRQQVEDYILEPADEPEDRDWG